MTSNFKGVYIALFDYEAQNEEELTIKESDLLYLLQTSDVDDWWKVKKRVVDADVEEPVGLVPSTYIEPAPVTSSAIALYDYDKQTEEELTFTEGTKFDIYDTSDENWILVGINNSQFGFAPANYIEIGGSSTQDKPQQQQDQQQSSSLSGYGSKSALSNFPPPPQRSKEPSIEPEIEAPTPKTPTKPSTIDSPTYGSDEEPAPPMPSRPRGNTSSSRRTLAESSEDLLDQGNSSSHNNGFSDDFFTWNVHEIDGKKKRKCVLAIGNMSIYVSFDNSSTSKEWTIRDLISYNNEKKHVFLELKNPYASYELHAGSKDSAEAIISILTDLKTMTSMGALKEVRDASIATGPSSSSQKQGKILYDFEAASGDELTCYEGDIVVILNDKKSKEWWMVRNLKTGKQGVVPSNYIKVESSSSSSSGGLKALFSRKSSQSSLLSPKKKKSKDKMRAKERQKEAERRYDLDVENDHQVIELQREREDLERERRRQKRKEKELRDREDRERIRKADERQRQKAISKSKSSSSSSSKKDSSKPNPHRVRTWIDRSGAFKVEAEFLGCSDGKIHLHKINGVKIAVAAPKLSTEDLEYVERITGMSLDNYKQPKKESPAPEKPIRAPQSSAIISTEPTTSKVKDVPFNEKLNDYWFDFFVECGVDANVCDRYARNFTNEQMDEAILEDISPSLMRTLGLREGDILRVTKFLDNKYGRSKKDETSPANGGLFSGPDGSLKNNKGVNEVVNGSALGGHKFEDDAWASKPAIQSTETARPVTPQLTGSIQDLVNIKPMEPSKTGSSLNLPIKPVTSTTSTAPAPLPKDFPPMKPQMTNATVGTQPTGALMAMPTGFMPITMIPMMTGQATGFMPLQPTGVTINKTGQFNGLPTTSFGQTQQTGGFMMPLSTGIVASMPNTTFGAQRTGGLLPIATGFGQQKTGGILPTPLTSFGATAPNGGMVQLQPTGLTLQKTGNLAPINQTQSFPSMLPNMRTGGLPNAMTGGFSNSMPVTSFGQSAQMNSFGGQTTGFINPAYTGGLPPQQFNMGLPNVNPGLQFGNPTGTLPQTNYGANMPNIGQQTGGFQPQSNFGVNQLSNMFSNTTINQQQQQPQFQQQAPAFTSFGADSNGFQQQQQQPLPLASQPTGLGFGNSPSSYGQQQPQTSFGGLGAQPTGRRANLANATADNPFGF